MDINKDHNTLKGCIMLTITLRDRGTNDLARQITKVPDVVEKVAKFKWSHAVNVA